MRKFQTIISFFLIIAVTVLLVGLFSTGRAEKETQADTPARERADVTHNFLLCI